MAEHVHTMPTRQPLKVAGYRSDPLPETALQILVATAAWLNARDAQRVRTSTQTRAELRTRPLIDLAAYREARA